MDERSSFGTVSKHGCFFRDARARNTHVEAHSNHTFPAKVAIVDNTPYVFGFQPDNAIPIESWYDDEADDELDKLKALLDRLEHAPDVRPLLVDAFALRAKIDDADALSRRNDKYL